MAPRIQHAARSRAVAGRHRRTTLATRWSPLRRSKSSRVTNNLNCVVTFAGGGPRPRLRQRRLLVEPGQSGAAV